MGGHKKQPVANFFQDFFVKQQARVKTLVVKRTSMQRGIMRGKFINGSAQACSLPNGTGDRAETNDLTLCKIQSQADTVGMFLEPSELHLQ